MSITFTLKYSTCPPIRRNNQSQARDFVKYLTLILTKLDLGDSIYLHIHRTKTGLDLRLRNMS